MFWSKARATYRDVPADDEDIRRFLELSNRFQADIYEGLAGKIQDQGHRWVAERTPAGRVLEIGFGAGRHALFFSGRREDYFASEYSPAHASTARWKELRGRVLRCDARRLPFVTESFEAVISIYNLEHIADLQSVFREVRRVLAPRGVFLIALPCEGGFAWNLGRELTSRRIFMKRYGINYDKVIAYEHVWDFGGIRSQLIASRLFTIRAQRFLPFRIPLVDVNLVGCLECTKAGATKPEPDESRGV